MAEKFVPLDTVRMRTEMIAKKVVRAIYGSVGPCFYDRYWLRTVIVAVVMGGLCSLPMTLKASEPIPQIQNLVDFRNVVFGSKEHSGLQYRRAFKWGKEELRVGVLRPNSFRDFDSVVRDVFDMFDDAGISASLIHSGKADIGFIFSEDPASAVRGKYRQFLLAALPDGSGAGEVEKFARSLEQRGGDCLSQIGVNERYEIVSTVTFVSSKLSDIDVRRCISQEALRILGLVGYAERGSVDSVLINGTQRYWPTILDVQYIKALYSEKIISGMTIEEFDRLFFI